MGLHHNILLQSCIHCLVLTLEYVASYLQNPEGEFVKMARLDLLKMSSFAHQRSLFLKLLNHLVFTVGTVTLQFHVGLVDGNG